MSTERCIIMDCKGCFKFFDIASPFDNEHRETLQKRLQNVIDDYVTRIESYLLMILRGVKVGYYSKVGKSGSRVFFRLLSLKNRLGYYRKYQVGYRKFEI